MLTQEHRSQEELDEALLFLASDPLDEVRMMVPEHPKVFRLLLERDGDEQVGITAFKRCGPFAADLLYGVAGYGPPLENASPTLREALEAERRAALMIMKHVGAEGAYGPLNELRGWGPWHQLLRRVELHEPHSDPLIARLARQLGRTVNKQDQVETWNQMPADQLRSLQTPPRAAEQALEFLPGYVAIKATYDASRGYHLDNAEVGWAVFDAVLTATMIGELAGQTVKTVGKQATKSALEIATLDVERNAARELTTEGLKQLSRETLDRLPSAAWLLIKSLPKNIARADITKVMQSASGIARRLGVRTWGKLDRRIIMRRDRRVVVDLMNPDFQNQLKNVVGDELYWASVAHGVGQFATWIMERTVPRLQLAN